MALPTEERIKLQAQPFDGKKQCWVPDAKESFIAAEITSTKGEEVTVKTDKGEVCSIQNRLSIKYMIFFFFLEYYIKKG